MMQKILQKNRRKALLWQLALEKMFRPRREKYAAPASARKVRVTVFAGSDAIGGMADEF